MNLREYAQAQEVQDAPQEQEPVKKKKGKRLKVTLQNSAEPTGWGRDIIDLHESGYTYAVLIQLLLLQDYISTDNSEAYWQGLIDKAGELTGALRGTEAGELAQELTFTTINYLEKKAKALKENN